MIVRAIVRTGRRRWTLFEDPLPEPLETWIPGDIPGMLRILEDRVESTGVSAVGFLTYEAAAAYDLAVHAEPGPLPLLSFSLFRVRRDVSSLMNSPPPRGAGYSAGPWTNSLDEEAYRERITRIRSFLHAGDTYQVNFTFPMKTPFRGDPEAYFRDMCAAQDGEYATYLELDTGHSVLSASPELFLRRRGSRLLSKPMKGTAPRGRTLQEDHAGIRALRASPKERAENLMITDMIRNDLGRVAIPGSVRVPRLFEIERYPRVLQMISRVEARSDVSLADLLAATFPCASITGAPKKRTMEIIRELEKTPRGIYTGTIGVVEPRCRMRFNVAIRTVVVDSSAGEATFGVGGGIVWDSRPRGEYRECATKANILAVPDPPVTLLETVRWNPDRGITLYDGHHRRLRTSARYFRMAPLSSLAGGFPGEEDLNRRIRDAAAQAHPAVDRNTDWIVRILVRRDSLELHAEPLPGRPLDILGPPARIPRRNTAFSPDPVPQDQPWLYHKTTRRELYRARLAASPHADDVLLCNAAGNLTESCIASIVVARRHQPYLATPPVTEGLLPGVFREWLLNPPRGVVPWTPGGLPVVEEPISTDVLDQVRDGMADLYLVNSVRGWMRAHLVPMVAPDREDQADQEDQADRADSLTSRAGAGLYSVS